MNSAFEQGEIIECDFDPTLGHEPAKRRPALVVSVGFFNNVLSSLTVVCPITSTASRHPLHIRIPEGHTARGFICVEQMRAMDLNKRHCVKLEDSLNEATMSTILEAIGGIFGI